MPAIDLPAKMRETVERHAMFAPGQTVVVAVSGGADSVALLHALQDQKTEWGLTLVGAHLDHGFRGEESAADAAYVGELCNFLNIPCRIAYEDVPAAKKRLHLSSQEAARQIRHGFLRRVAKEVGAQVIALGHTRSDRTETVLLNLFRGAGLEGLGGFPPVRRPLVRPLYDVSREETQAYCALRNLHPRFDSSNAKTDYRRNRMRSELLPYLATYYNAKIEDAILRMADLVSADNAVLDLLAAESLADIITEQTDTYLVLNSVKLNQLVPAMRRRIVRQAIVRIRGSLNDLRFDFLETLLSACEQGSTHSEQMPPGANGVYAVRCRRAELVIHQVEAPEATAAWEVTLKIPGLTEIPAADVVLETRVYETREELWSFLQSAQKAEAYLFPLEAVRLPLTARSRRAGDRMRPRGLNGSKKLQDIFVDRKIPARDRDRIPIITEADKEDAPSRILAVVGVAADETMLPIKEIAEEARNNGPYLLLLAHSDRFFT